MALRGNSKPFLACPIDKERARAGVSGGFDGQYFQGLWRRSIGLGTLFQGKNSNVCGNDPGAIAQRL